MQVIDENGRLFGTINVIDALVVLFVLAVVVAGIALVTGGGTSATPEDGETPTRTVVFQTGAQPGYVIDAVTEGPVPTGSIVAIEDKTVTPMNGSLSRLRLTVTLEVEETGDGLPTYGGQRLYIGREMQLDLGSTIVSGTVVDMRS